MPMDFPRILALGTAGSGNTLPIESEFYHSGLAVAAIWGSLIFRSSRKKKPSEIADAGVCQGTKAAERGILVARRKFFAFALDHDNKRVTSLPFDD